MVEQQTHRIGQIIYILSQKSSSVVPAIIAGRTITETLEGEVVSYKVKVGPPNKVQIVDLNRIDGELYTSLDEVRNLLQKNLTDWVNNLVAVTQEKTSSWYGVQGNTSMISGGLNNSTEKLDPEQLINAVESGVQIPQGPPQPSGPHPLQLQQSAPVQLRDQVRTMVTDDSGFGLDIGGPGDQSGEAVVMPDGTIRPLKTSI